MGFTDGAIEGAAVTTAPSFKVKLAMILTLVCEGAQPPMIVTDPEPAAGITSSPAPLANRLPVHPPPVNDPLVVSNTYSPEVLEMCTVSDSPGT